MNFQGPPSPFVTPETNRYKNGEGESIRNMLDGKLSTPEQVRRAASEFLATQPELLSEEEFAQFKAFADHGIKRILNAESQKRRGIKLRLFLTKLGVPLDNYVTFPVLYHDLSHVAGAVIQGKYAQNSVVPPVLRYKEGEDVNRRELFEDELYGVLWDKTNYMGTGQMENFTLHALKQASNIDSFILLYIDGVMKMSFNENEDGVTRQVELSTEIHLIDEKINKKLAEANTIVAKIKNNPPQEIIRLLTYIWEHRNNPRVLADLFFQEVGPHITELQKRKPYSPQARLKK